jgi:hypothetical protein
MTTEPRSPGEHYIEATRLIAAAPETPETAPILAVAHALMASTPRRVVRKATQHPDEPPAGESWLFGGNR